MGHEARLPYLMFLSWFILLTLMSVVCNIPGMWRQKNIFNSIVIKGVNHIDTDNIFPFIFWYNMPKNSDHLWLEITKLGILFLFYQQFLQFGGVIYFIVYLSLGTSFRTMITPVFFICPFEGIGHESSFAYLFGKIYHFKGKQKLIIPKTSDLKYLWKWSLCHADL